MMINAVPLSSTLRLLLPIALLAGCATEDVLVDSPAPNGNPDLADLVVTVTEAATGAPVVGAWVVESPTGRDAQTDADGVARFADIGAGDFLLDATATGHEAVEGQAVTVGYTDKKAKIELRSRVAGTGALGGYVYEPGAAAVAAVGARIEVDGEQVAQTDEDGAWRATGLTPGAHVLRVNPPVGSSMLSWQGPNALDVSSGETTFTAVTLPGAAPADADFVGSDTCVACHTDTGHGHMGAKFSRAEIEASGASGLAAAFAAGDVVSLAPDWPDATVTLGSDWTMVVDDGHGGRSGALAVTEVYGGNKQGVAFGVEVDGVTQVAPIAWAIAQGPGATDGWAATWADPWFDAAGRLQDADADWALQCAGCHVTGHKLVEGGGAYTIDPVGSGEVELGVGCEACHGAGSTHSDDQLATSILNPTYLPAATRDDGCARCHANTTSLHAPFADDPAWPVDAHGVFPGPEVELASVATKTPDRWETVPVSRVWADQSGDFATSPHRTGAYLGSCQDCHDPHGSTFDAGLHVDANDRRLCTSCHAGLFPDDASVTAHSHHVELVEADWGPSTCVGCHFPRSGVLVRPDPLSGVGETHAHAMLPWSPALTVDAFGDATELPLGAVPTSACLDCHLQARAQADLDGVGLSAPGGDATLRSTHENLALVYGYLFPESP